MSGHLAVIPSRAVFDDRLGLTALRVLAAFGSYTDKSGWCRVKQDTIADQLGVGRTAIANHQRQLVKLGYLEAKRTGRSSIIRVILDVPGPAPELADLTSDVTSDLTSDVTPAQTSDVTQLADIHRTTVSNDVLQRQHRAPALNNGNGHDPTTTSFGAFWSVYPRKAAKDAARKAWAKAVAKTTAEVIIAGADRYARDRNRDPAFTAHPATWLNAGQWDDEPMPARLDRNGNAKVAVNPNLAEWER